MKIALIIRLQDGFPMALHEEIDMELSSIWIFGEATTSSLVNRKSVQCAILQPDEALAVGAPPRCLIGMRSRLQLLPAW